MLIIGLTGPTGAGKSTVALELKLKGFFIIDADKVAREVTAAGSPVLPLLAERFGSDIILPDGTLNRHLLADRAFSSPENTKALNDITHPAITEKIFDAVRVAADSGYDVCVIDAAALRESGIGGRCDIIVTVTAPRELRIKRIIQRDGISPQAAQKRAGAQGNEEYYSEFADIIIVNDCTPSLKKGLDILCDRIDSIRERNDNGSST